MRMLIGSQKSKVDITGGLHPIVVIIMKFLQKAAGSPTKTMNSPPCPLTPTWNVILDNTVLALSKYILLWQASWAKVLLGKAT